MGQMSVTARRHPLLQLLEPVEDEVDDRLGGGNHRCRAGNVILSTTAAPIRALGHEEYSQG